MRIKALVCAALAAGALTSMAQVYSANIVGYVNVPIAGDNALTLIANPLKPANGDYNITNTIVLPDTADTAQIFKWAGTAWANDIPSWIAGYGWYPDVEMALGEGFFIQSPVATSITFVGEVATGTLSTTFAPGMNLVANKVPEAAPWPGSTVGRDTDALFLWAGSAWDNTIWTFIDGYGWYGTGDPAESINGPVVNPGQGLFYQNNATTDLAWDRVFNP